MDQAETLLHAVIERLGALQADVSGVKELLLEAPACSEDSRILWRDAHERLDQIEERLDYLGAKWVEHDMLIRRIRLRRA